MTNSIFGTSDYDYGPGNLYFDSATGGDNLYLGCTETTSVNMAITKIEFKCSQEGDMPSDRAISGQSWTLNAGMVKSTVERVEPTVQGIEVEENTAGDPIRIWLSDLQGQKDSSIWKQMTFKKIVDGLESVYPFDIFDFWLSAPMVESLEMLFDATTMRIVPVVFNCYRDSNHPDHNGRATFGASREIV